MLEQLNQWDIDFFLFLNGFHNLFWDKWMSKLTEPNFWWWYFIAVIGLIIYYKKKEGLWYILAIIVSIVISDQIASSIFKPLFERLRPCYNPAIALLIHQPKDYGCGGQYGFFSSHSATAFSLVFYLYLIFKPYQKGLIIFSWVWVIVYSYTRIYLGKHYPLDIICGGICGILVAYGVYLSFQTIRKKFVLQ